MTRLPQDTLYYRMVGIFREAKFKFTEPQFIVLQKILMG